ncbi:hypothetical protein GGP41_002380 [Bipolaris sorokiniana]|uniref:Secreted protein n=1 Tax=Cochliobolus sativus TaxID=45130 RepID=A0A8H6DW67_COCSA|nr:hypothetical protein GGP41_002380 [Bipolaris sorokiniana]
MHLACGLVFCLPVSAAILGRQNVVVWCGVVQAWSSDVSVIDGVCTTDAEHGHCAGMQRAIDSPSPSPTKQRNALGPARHGTWQTRTVERGRLGPTCRRISEAWRVWRLATPETNAAV